MSSDHQDTRALEPPSITDELQSQPSSSTTRNTLPDCTTLRLPRTPSPLSTAVETIPPESPIAGALGGAISATPSTPFLDALPATTTAKTHNQLRLSDTNPSTITTTPPKVPEPARRKSLLRLSHFDPINADCEESQKTKTPSPRIPPPPNSRTSPLGSSSRKQNPQSQMNEIGSKFWGIKRRFLGHVEDDNLLQSMMDHEEEYLLLKLDDGGCMLSGSFGTRKGCTDVVFFIIIILAIFFIFVTGLTVYFHLFSNFVRDLFHTLP